MQHILFSAKKKRQCVTAEIKDKCYTSKVRLHAQRLQCTLEGGNVKEKVEGDNAMSGEDKLCCAILGKNQSLKNHNSSESTVSKKLVDWDTHRVVDIGSQQLKFLDLSSEGRLTWQ